MINFWDESIWLPINTTWKDIENGPDKKIIYGTIHDLLVQFPLVAIIFVLRHICDKNVFRPLGNYLKISEGTRRRAPENYVLEAYYRKGKDLPQIAKKVDMSQRQVERWWRLRRSQDKPSTLVKFTETMWKASFYLCKECYAVSILWSKEWAWNIDLILYGYPHHGLTSDVKWYYIISSAFYWSLTISQFYDVRRKDFWQLFVHHIATIILISLSWICNIHRIGSLVLIVHDVSDVFLELAKAAKYAKAQTLVNFIFFIFVLVWTSMRLYAFPIMLFRIGEEIISNLHFFFPMFIFLYVLLYFLMVLNLFWTWIILRSLFRMAFCGEAEDVRSSSSEISSNDSSSKEHNDSKLKTN